MTTSRINWLLLVAMIASVPAQHRGVATATATPASPEMFVRAMNFSFFMGGMMALVAMVCSALRGKPIRV